MLKVEHIRRGVGHTTALIDAARQNPRLWIVGMPPAVKLINKRLGRRQAVTPAEFASGDCGALPVVFDNSAVANLICGKDV